MKKALLALYFLLACFGLQVNNNNNNNNINNTSNNNESEKKKNLVGFYISISILDYNRIIIVYRLHKYLTPKYLS